MFVLWPPVKVAQRCHLTNFTFSDLNAKGRGDKGKGVKSSRWFRRLTAVTAAPHQSSIFPSRPRRDGRRRQARPCHAAAAAFGREGGLHAPHLPLPPRHQRLHRRWERKPRTDWSPPFPLMCARWAHYGSFDSILGCELCLLRFFGSALCRLCSRKVANDRFAVKIRD